MKPLLLFLLLLPFTVLSAQGEEAALVMSSDGELHYQPPGGTSFRVYTGTYLVGEGQLRLVAPASVEISKRGKFVRLNEAGTYALGELFAASPEPSGFLTRFTNFIRRGVDQSENKDKLEDEYLRNQGNAQGNIRGLTDRGLVGYFPFGGKLPAGEQRFAWPEVDATPSYTFSLVDSTSQEVILTARTAGSELVVDLDQLALMDGRRYYWQATPQAAGGTRRLGVGTTGQAPPLRIHFTYTDRAPADLQREVSEQLVPLAERGPMTWALAEAMLLEEAGYLAAADTAYRSAVSATADATVAKRAYATFLARWNLRRAANELID